MTNSVLSLITPPNVIRKQHFWDWFDGTQLKSIWDATTIGGGTHAMDDNTNGGFEFTSSTTNGSTGLITFNDKRHYAHNGSVVIGVVKSDLATSQFLQFGLTEQASAPTDTRAMYINWSVNTYQRLQCTLNGTSSTTDTSQTVDTNTHRAKVTLDTTSCKLLLDGVFEGVSTSNLPDVTMQPYWRCANQGTVTRVFHIRYLEAYNT